MFVTIFVQQVKIMRAIYSDLFDNKYDICKNICSTSGDNDCVKVDENDIQWSTLLSSMDIIFYRRMRTEDGISDY